MLISVTEFFRDSTTFKQLTEQVIPALLNKKRANEPIRIWVAGCATGEEAYSIIMRLEDYLGKTSPGRTLKDIKIQLFATDLSTAAITKARTGIYKGSELKMFSKEDLERFFTKVDGSYQVNKSIRECCVFATHNLFKDPPFSKIDMISCRNVLIYLQPILQKKALAILHYTLNAKGILILGKSETIGPNTQLFSSLSQREKFFIKRGVSGHSVIASQPGTKYLITNEEKIISPVMQISTTVSVYKKVDEILLAKYIPAGVLINDNFDIIQFRGITDPWLTLSPVKASFNILKMAREGLSFELRSILHLAKTKMAPAKKEGIAFRSNETQLYVSIEAIPVVDTPELHFLVLFENKTPFNRFGIPDDQPQNNENELNNALSDRIFLLEKELSKNREEMRAITENQEAANEELQSANEELLSGSEELQVMNEELETVKEELQSTNEELTSLNHELVDRYEQLNKSRKFTEGIFNTIRDPLLVLDQDFRITMATAGFYKKFELAGTDMEEKLFFHVMDGVWNIPSLRNCLENSSSENSSFTDLEVTITFSEVGERNLVLNGRQLERIDGHKMMLLGIEDITDKKIVEANMVALSKLNEDLEHSNLELEQFAGIAAHDLQEPLRKIITFINIISEKKWEISENALPYLSKIATSTQRMQSIVRDLLDYSRIFDGDKIFVHTDLNEIIRNIMNDFEIAIQEKKAEIIIKDLPVIPGIPLYINQLFYNLFNNSLKFIRADTIPRIEIYANKLTKTALARHTELNQKLSYVEIILSDNGIGFNQKYAEKIFTLFYRLHKQTEFSGTGIGLALCRKIVLQHEGKIYVESIENKGTVFHILLPAAK